MSSSGGRSRGRNLGRDTPTIDPGPPAWKNPDRRGTPREPTMHSDATTVSDYLAGLGEVNQNWASRVSVFSSQGVALENP